MSTALLDHLAGLRAGLEGPVLVAVSGGGDSLALLDLARRALPDAVAAVTLDHGLRPEAADEARMVAEYCAAHGIAHQILTWTGWDGQGNLQAEARAARYRLIGDWARRGGFAEVWLAHSRDDVAETMLIRLGRAAGLDGLSRMAETFTREGMRWRRPLLDISREALRRHLRDQGLTWVEDPSNRDPRYARVRAREALSELEPLGISAAALAQSAKALASSRALIEEILIRDWRQRMRLQGGDILLSLEGAGPELSRRLILAAVQWMGGLEWPVRQSAFEETMIRLQSNPHHTVGGCLLSREPDGLRIAREWQAVRDHAVPYGALWDGRWQISGQGDQPEGLEIRALGEGIALCEAWRSTGLPRRSLMAGPALWRRNCLVSAPLAGKGVGFHAKLRPSFATHPFAH